MPPQAHAASSEKALLTFAVFACDQEHFIGEAVEAAFAQTYSPLEIILSDDCSEDRTFTIMRDLALSYRGPHRVVLNRHSTRRGIGAHVNTVTELARGDLVVGADGDDVSLPHRTQVMCAAWERTGRQAAYLHSNFIQIDKHDRTIGQVFTWRMNTTVEQTIEPLAYVQTLDPIIFGCGHAYSRRLLQVFGNLPQHLVHADNVLAFRAILDGRRLVSIDEPLVKYRLHDNNVHLRVSSSCLDLGSLERQEERVRQDVGSREAMYDAFIADLETAREKNLISQAEFEPSVAAAACMGRRYALQREFFEQGLLGKCRILARLERDGLDQPALGRLVRRLIPQSMFLRLKLIRNYYGGR